MHTRGCPLCGTSPTHSYFTASRRYGSKDYDLHLLRCVECGFVFLGNEILIDYDADYLEREQVITRDDPYAQFRAGERIDSIARFVAPSPARAFLDIGIGDGLLLHLAEKAGYTTYGLDINEDGLRMARSSYGIRAALSLQPMDEAFPGMTFDVIHMNEVIEHVTDPMPLLNSCRTRLNKNGCLVIQTGNIDSFVSKVKGRSWDYIRPVHVSYFSTKTLLYSITKAGFEPVRWMTTDWRAGSVADLTGRLIKHGDVKGGVKMAVFYSTSIAHGIRRNVVVYAT